MNSVEQNSDEIYREKYKDLLSPSDAYQFFLKIQFMIPKMARQPETNYINFIVFAMNHLSKLKEKESCTALLDLSIKNFIKYHQAPENPELFVQKFQYLYNIVPKKSDKTSFESVFLEYCDKCKISDEIMTKSNIYEDFANDCIDNEFFIRGYRFSLKTQNLEILKKELTNLFKWDKLQIPPIEQMYFIARTCMEIIVMKNIPLAKEFICNYVKTIDNYNFNHPIVNYAFLLVNLLSSTDEKVNNYESFSKLNQCYKNAIDKEKTVGKYLNKISLMYYKKSTTNDTSGFSLFNFLRAFTG